MTQAKVVPAQAPAAPQASGATVVRPSALAGPPRTAQEFRALKARRGELSDQITSATDRRVDIAKQMRTATGADRAGLEQRLAVLDTRIARLEGELDATGQQLLDSPAFTTQAGPIQNFGPTISMNAVPILIVFTIFVLCPIALAAARSIWKRGSLPRPVSDRDTTARLERMEQAMDAIAIEIERVSEGQRFVTRLLADGKTALPIPVAQQGERVG